jgi:LysM repeat protein
MKISDLFEANIDGLVFDPVTGTFSEPKPKPKIPPLERYDVDWAKFKLTIAAIGAQREGLEDFSKIDAIVFLGLIGDPNIKDTYSGKTIDVYTKPAVFGRTNDANIDAADFRRTSGLAIMQSTPGGISGDLGAHKFDIIINHNYIDMANSESATTVAHEARHRGLHMICRIPDILNKVPANIRSESWAATWTNDNISKYFKMHHPKSNDSVEHMLIYAAETGNGRVHPEGMFTTVDELKQWRSWYMAIAAAAKSYVLNIPVPKGSALEDLRKDLDDNKTPKKLAVQVAQADQDGVTFITVPKVPTVKQPSKEPSTGAGPITWQDIYQANKGLIGSNPNLIKPGQRLTIPNHGTYEVKPGDTLSKIAIAQQNKNPVKEQDDQVLEQIKRIKFSS